MSKELQDFLAYADKRGQEDPDPDVRSVCTHLTEALRLGEETFNRVSEQQRGEVERKIKEIERGNSR